MVAASIAIAAGLRGGLVPAPLVAVAALLSYNTSSQLTLAFLPPGLKILPYCLDTFNNSYCGTVVLVITTGSIGP